MRGKWALIAGGALLAVLLVVAAHAAYQRDRKDLAALGLIAVAALSSVAMRRALGRARSSE